MENQVKVVVEAKVVVLEAKLQLVGSMDHVTPLSVQAKI